MLRGASAEAQADLTSELEGSQGDAAKLGGGALRSRRRASRRACGAPDPHRRLGRGRREGGPRRRRLRQRLGRGRHGAGQVGREAPLDRLARPRRRDRGARRARRSQVRRRRRQQDQRRALRGPSGRRPDATVCARRSPTRTRSASDKGELLRTLFEGKLLPATMLLVEQAAAGRHGAIDGALEKFQHTAAHSHRREDRDRARRPGALRRRAQPAGRGARLAVRHRRSICWSCWTPTIVGGIRVEIGDDVIDGTVASKLEDAQRKLAG